MSFYPPFLFFDNDFEVDYDKFQQTVESEVFDPPLYVGKVTHFHVIEDLTPGFSFPQGLGWEKHSINEFHVVPGNHLSMMELPHVQELAEKLKICLDKE